MLIQEQKTSPQLAFRKIYTQQIHKLGSLFKLVRIIMNALGYFTVEMMISLSLSFFTLWMLTKPLTNVLNDLCPTKTQADFWLAYTRIMLIISPLLLVLMVSLNSQHKNTIDSIKFSMVSALVGLLLGMLIVGKKIFEPANNQCSLKAE